MRFVSGLEFAKLCDLPIIMVDDWEVVDRNFLDFKYNLFVSKKFSREKLSMEYLGLSNNFN